MKPNRLSVWLVVLVASGALPNQALAYIGPGAGLSAIGTLVAVIGAFFLLLVGFVWYPVKRLLNGRKTGGNTTDSKPAGPER